MSKYDEIEIIKRAYDELKALDPEGQMRAIDYLRDRLAADRQEAKKAREQATRERIAERRSQRTIPE